MPLVYKQGESEMTDTGVVARYKNKLKKKGKDLAEGAKVLGQIGKAVVTDPLGIKRTRKMIEQMNTPEYEEMMRGKANEIMADRDKDQKKLLKRMKIRKEKIVSK